MIKRKRTKGQITIYKTLHLKPSIDRVTRTPLKPGMNSGGPEECLISTTCIDLADFW